MRMRKQAKVRAIERAKESERDRQSKIERLREREQEARDSRLVMECVGGWSVSGKVRRYGTRGGRIEVG